MTAPFKPFDGMQKPPAGPPPNPEVARLKAALQRTLEHVRKLEGEIENYKAEQSRADKKVAVLQKALQSAQRQLWDARALLWEFQNPQQQQQPQQQHPPPQQWPPRPTQKRGAEPEVPGLRVTKASRSSSDPA